MIFITSELLASLGWAQLTPGGEDGNNAAKNQAHRITILERLDGGKSKSLKLQSVLGT